jgi:hypothetical protein
MLRFETPPKHRPTLRIKQMATASGRGILKEFLNSAARADFNVRVAYLSSIRRESWTDQQFKAVGDGIWEIKWKSGNKQWRALGFDHQWYFIVVRACTHKGRVYDPHDCIPRAKELRSEAQTGKRNVIGYEF